MSFGVFIHRSDSVYKDVPTERYQFPRVYLDRAKRCIGDWIVYFEPVKVRGSRGYYAVARVEGVVPDPSEPGMYLALIEKGSYLEFAPSVPKRVDGMLVERDCPNDQWAVRPLSAPDFARIIALGLPDDELMPQRGDVVPDYRVQDLQAPYEVERIIIQSLVNRPFRDRAFRRAVIDAYDARCAVTGWKLINGGGLAEAEAAHIRPVEHGGPDSIQNGIALSRSIHWMFDRGLIGLADDLEILISRQVNDRESVERIINTSGKAIAPERIALCPHPAFLRWHRENCFKG